MLFLAASALSLVLPTPVPPVALVQPAPAAREVTQRIASDDALLFPATQLLAGGQVVKEAGGLFDGPRRDVYSGEIDLESLIDSIPSGAKKGKQKVDPGLQRLRERQAAEDAAAKKKYDEVLAAEAAGKDISFAGETKETVNAGIAAANALFNRE